MYAFSQCKQQIILKVGGSMEDKNPTYKYIEIVGTSKEGMDQAVRNAIEKASRTVRHIHWFYIAETRGTVKDGEITCFQVTVKAGVKIE